MTFSSYEHCFSYKDKIEKLSIPKQITPELAEFIGILVGDGHVEDRVRKDRGSKGVKVYEFQISGNLVDEVYYDDYVSILSAKLFNLKMQKVVRAKHHSVILFKNSKAIHTFITNEFKIPARKHDIQIPDKIKSSNKDCKAAFLRGLFDADGCIVIKSKPNKYPVVQFASKSQLLIDQVSLLLLELGVESCKYKESHFDKRTNKTYTIYHTHINGRKRVSAFMQNVGFSNINKTKKYEDFQEAK